MRKVTTIVALALGLSMILPAQAIEKNVIGMQKAQQVHFLGKRPFQQVVVAKADSEQAWVGATLRVEGTQQQAFKLHNLGKRAF